MPDDAWSPPPVLLTVDLVILTLRESRLHVLLVERGEEPFQGALALPGGFLNHDEEEILDAAHRELSEETALTSGWVHLEQLAVYGSPGRDPRGRVVSVAHLAIAPGLPDPVAGTDATEAAWIPADAVLSGETALAFDHRRIAEDGIERARAKIEFSALATAFCGESFTIAEPPAGVRGRLGHSARHPQLLSEGPGREGIHRSHRRGPQGHRGRPARLYRAGPNTVLFPPLIRPRTTEEEE